MLKGFRTFVTMLLILTPFWGVFFYRSILEWNEHVEDYYESFEVERQRVLEEHGLHIDPALTPPYWSWNCGGILLIVGFVLLSTWILTAVQKFGQSKIELFSSKVLHNPH